MIMNENNDAPWSGTECSFTLPGNFLEGKDVHWWTIVLFANPVRNTKLLPVPSNPERSRDLLHEIYAVLGRVTEIDQFHLYGRGQPEIPEYGHIAGDSIQVVIPEVFSCLFHKPV